MTLEKAVDEKTAGDLIIEADALVSFLQEAIAAILEHTLDQSTNLYKRTPLGIHLVFECIRERLERAHNLIDTPSGGEDKGNLSILRGGGE
jgi:hypothetical protein